MQFFSDLSVNPLLLPGLVAGILAGTACGAIGPYVVARGIVFLAGAIAHIALAGIGAAVFLSEKFPGAFGWLEPLHGAAVVALLGAVLIGLLHQRATERMDTLIGAVWAVAMAIGILLMKFTDGYDRELMGYLFGNVSAVWWTDVYLVAGMTVAILIFVVVFHKRLLAICLDEQQARLQGVNVMLTHVLLLSVVALTVICLVPVVGLILMLALLTLPAATAGHHLSRLASMTFVAAMLCVLCTTVPRVAVYGTRVSPEAAIVLASAGVYLVSLAVRLLRSRGRATRRATG